MTHEAADLLLETLRLHSDVEAAALGERWSAVHLAGLEALATYEGCVLWLHRRLTDRRLFDAVPAAFAEWLATRARHLAAKNLMVDAQRDEVVQILNELRVPHVLLKGAARRLAADRYPYADARATTDVDVLVPKHLALPTWTRFREAGFRAPATALRQYDGHFHLPPLRNGRPVTVELHTSTSSFVPPRVAWTRHESGQPASCSGGATRIPAATELLWHAITHAPLPLAHSFRLRYLQDAAVIWAAASDVDWTEIDARLASDELPHPGLTRRWLGTAARLGSRPGAPRPLAALPALDVAKALSWRLGVFRLPRTGGRRPPPPVWGPHPLSRGRRLLIDAAARAELRLPLIPPRGTTPLLRAGRRAAAGAARLCYGAWRLLRQA